MEYEQMLGKPSMQEAFANEADPVRAMKVSARFTRVDHYRQDFLTLDIDALTELPAAMNEFITQQYEVDR